MGTSTIPVPLSHGWGGLREKMAGVYTEGAAQPPNTPLARPSQEHMSKALAAHGGGSAGRLGHTSR